MPEFSFEVLFRMALEIAAVVVVGLLLYFISSKVINKTAEFRGTDSRIARQIRTFIKYAIYSAATLALLGILGIDVTLIATSLGVAGIAFGFASRDLISNFLGGILLLVDRVYSVNDIVRIEGNYGIVRLITLRTTQIKTFDGNIVTIPNANIIDSIVVNMTSGEDTILSSISVNIAYEEDVDRVKNLMRESVPEEQSYSKGEIRFQVNEIGDRFHGYRVSMYLPVYAFEEPWITSEIREAAIGRLVDREVEFHKQAPRLAK
ncbi:MAG: mechanosensitive ion channel family protein [Candidatus Bathyarchaeia archaeon]